MSVRSYLDATDYGFLTNSFPCYLSIDGINLKDTKSIYCGI